ncbi:MAG: hypothetical protein E7011_00665 [Alphaproteobacteria bacterium]|nr:hypothetical protein [Alphaproteobacteria bacterium]
MKYRFLIASLCAMFVWPGMAADVATTSNTTNKQPRGMMGVLRNLTTEQQACITKEGCDMTEYQKKTVVEKKAEADKKAETAKKISPAEKEKRRENMRCIREAMVKCGVELPKIPDTLAGKNPNKTDK